METTPLSASSPLNKLTETSIRHGFVQKVYGILLCQLAATIAIGSQVMRLGEAWVLKNPNLLMVVLFGSFAISMGAMCALYCNPPLMRRTPHNYILLALFTLGKAVMIGFISIQYTQESVLVAMGITALVVFALTLFACQTSYDFAGMAPYVFACVMVLFGLGLVLSIASMLGAGGSQAFSTLRLVYAAGGALLFSFYIVYDTQQIAGGKTEYQYGIDDYVMATISLYMDITQLFVFLLQLFGDRRR